VQIPVMFSLYHVLRHVTPDKKLESTKRIYGWTVGLFDSASHAKLFGAPIAASFKSNAQDLANMHANGTTVKIVAGILVATMIITTFLTSRQMILKTGWSEDPQQRMMQRLMLYGIPVSLLVSGTVFPIGVVIYWTTTNIFSLGQQFWVLRKYPPPPSSTKATTTPARTGGGRSAPEPAPSLVDTIFGRKPKAPAQTGRTGAVAGRAGAAGKVGTAGKTGGKAGTATASAGSANGAAADGKSLAPKPGAKPVNPKRGAAGKRGTAPKARRMSG